MKKKLSLVVGTVMLASLIAGCNNSEAVAETSEVPTEEVVQEEVASTVEAWGSVSAETIKEVHLDFNATVTDVYVKEGQEVKAGDKLLSIDYEDYKTSIAQKEKELSLDQNALEGQIKSSGSNSERISSLRTQISDINSRLSNGTDSEIVVLEASLTTAKTNLATAQKDLEVQKELVAAGTATQKTVDDLENKIVDLKNEIGTIEKKITNTKKDREIEVKKLKSEIASLQADMSETQKNNQTSINASTIKQEIFDLEVAQMKNKYSKDFIKGNDIVLDIPRGVIKSVKVVEGSKIGGETNCLLEIIDEDSLVVKANVSEEFIKDVKVGADVNIIPYADREAVVKGKVKEIQNMAIDNNGETVIPIIVEATEESPYLKYGYSVDIEVYTE